MSEQKIDPSRPADDQAPAGTTYQPQATPPTSLPLGPETLEAQRKAMKQVEENEKKQKEHPEPVKEKAVVPAPVVQQVPVPVEPVPEPAKPKRGPKKSK